MTKTVKDSQLLSLVTPVLGQGENNGDAVMAEMEVTHGLPALNV